MKQKKNDLDEEFRCLRRPRPESLNPDEKNKLSRKKQELQNQRPEKCGDAQDSTCSGKTLPYNTYLATEEAFTPDELRSIPHVLRRRLLIYILRPAFQTEDAPPPRERKVNSIASAVHDVIMEIGLPAQKAQMPHFMKFFRHISDTGAPLSCSSRPSSGTFCSARESILKVLG